MKLSARIQSLTSSPIRKLSPYADAAKAKGKKIYHLNIGQPDIKTPDQFMESIRTYDEQVIAYGNSKGEGFLIEAIRKYYAEKGMDFAADDIFITNSVDFSAKLSGKSSIVSIKRLEYHDLVSWIT